MKRFISLSVLAGVILLIFSSTAPAASLSFDPVAPSAGLGMPVDVGIVISGLGDFVAPSLSTFDVTVLFDDSILSFDGTSVVFGPELDVLGFGSIQDVSGPPDVGIFELSFDFVLDLIDFQPGEFTLATITFDTIGLGLSSLSFAGVTLGDEFGDPLTLDVSGVGSVEVSAVPEPTTILLFGTGLGLMLAWKGIQKRKGRICSGSVN